MRLTSSFPAFALVFGFVTALVVPTACKPVYPEFAGPCDPSAIDPCPKGYVCCSDDPAAIDLADVEAFVTPTYEMSIFVEEDSNIPLFAGDGNSRSRSGMCSQGGPSGHTIGIPTDWGIMDCPVPCNPTWSDSDVAAVCDDDQICCPTGSVEPEDCVFDHSLGAHGCWRPAVGGDIVGLAGLDATDWAKDAHATHQDPGGLGCQAFVAGIDEATLAEHGLSAEMLEHECWRRLTVADQRGLCMDDFPGCPFAVEALDGCEQLNLAEALSGC